MPVFVSFPYLENDQLIIRKMTESDVDALMEISHSENVYRYIPPFLYKKSKGFLLTAIRNIGGRDFDKKKHIIAGIYLKGNPDLLVGLVEMFDYKVRTGQMTIGCRIHEAFWHRGIATNAIALMTQYLTVDMGVQTLHAYVMPENVHSARALLKNGFVKSQVQEEKEDWGGQDKAIVDVYTSGQVP